MIQVIDIDSQLKDTFKPIFTELCTTYLSSNGYMTKGVKNFVNKDLTRLWWRFSNSIQMKSQIIKRYEKNPPSMSMLSEEDLLRLKKGFKELDTKGLENLIVDIVVENFMQPDLEEEVVYKKGYEE